MLNIPFDHPFPTDFKYTKLSFAKILHLAAHDPFSAFCYISKRSSFCNQGWRMPYMSQNTPSFWPDTKFGKEYLLGWWKGNITDQSCQQPCQKDASAIRR